MTCERCSDYGLIHRVLTHPSVWCWLVDDNSLPPDQWRPLESDLAVYLLLRDGDEVLGIVFLAPQNSICWDVHVAFLPCAWGFRSVRAAEAAIMWIWENTICRRIVASIPAYNRVALRFAERCGFTRFGWNCNSFLRDGTLHSQLVLGLSREG